MTKPQLLMGSAEVCEVLEIDRSTLSRRVSRGELTPALQMPGETGAFLFHRPYIEALASVNEKAPAARTAEAGGQEPLTAQSPS